MSKYGYISLDMLYEYAMNTVDKTVSPNDFMRMPRANVIPIEWIRAYLNELNKEAEKEWEYVMNELGGYEPCYLEMYARGIKHLLKGWEKENE